MGAKVQLNLPNSLWTAKDTARLASNTLAMIKLRTSEGLDADRKPFKDYSIKPIYVAFRGARLKPKGGRPTNTTHQELAVKKQAKADLMNKVATDILKLREDMPLKRISAVKFDSIVLQCQVGLDIKHEDSYFNISRKTIQKE